MSSISHISLILPGVFERLGDWSHDGPLPLFPAIERVLSLSDKNEVGVLGYEPTLWTLFNPQYSQEEELPVGAQLSGINKGQVCCADPVHLRLEMGRLILIDQSQFIFREDERAAFSALINGYIKDIGGQYFFDNNGRGFLALKQSRSVGTTPLSQVIGKSIHSKMPEGERQAFWHQLINELQMLLHSAPFNADRRRRGEPEVNAVWMWGAGQQQKPMVAQHNNVYCNEPFAWELAKSEGISVRPLPMMFDVSMLSSSGPSLVVLNDLLAHSQYDNFPGWQVVMERYCVDWLMPLLDAVKKKRLRHLSLYPCNGTRYTLQPGQYRRFWRRLKPLLSYLD
jgi:hypothetical protein